MCYLLPAATATFKPTVRCVSPRRTEEGRARNELEANLLGGKRHRSRPRTVGRRTENQKSCLRTRLSGPGRIIHNGWDTTVKVFLSQDENMSKRRALPSAVFHKNLYPPGHRMIKGISLPLTVFFFFSSFSFTINTHQLSPSHPNV